MITQKEYKTHLGKLGRRFKNKNINWHSWYTQYLFYETMWINYFEEFVQNYSSTEERNNIQFVFWESCPGGMPFPHQNYAFDSNRYNNTIDGTFDSYLKRECVYFNINWEKRKITEILTELSQKGIIIIDLYLTHGIDLSSKKNKIRKNLFENVFNTYSIKKLEIIGNITICFDKDPKIKVTDELWNSGVNNDMNDDLKRIIQRALNLKCIPVFHIEKPLA